MSKQDLEAEQLRMDAALDQALANMCEAKELVMAVYEAYGDEEKVRALVRRVGIHPFFDGVKLCLSFCAASIWKAEHQKMILNMDTPEG